jgi:hypothetical protein
MNSNVRRLFPFGNYIPTIPWQKEGRKERRKNNTHWKLHYYYPVAKGRKEGKKEENDKE